MEDSMARSARSTLDRKIWLLPIALVMGCSPAAGLPVTPPADEGGPPGPDSGPGPDGRDPVTDVTLDPPATPELGWQYAVPSFPVDPGSEIQQCFFYTVPYDTKVFVNHIEIAQTTGTHHMNIFRVKTIKNLDPSQGVVVNGECWKPTNWSDWPLVINSQNEGHVDFTLPDGVAHRFEPGETLMLQTHYVNASTQKTPGAGRILVNFNRLPAEAVAAELGTAFATNQSIRICPGDGARHFETTCTFARNTATIFAANGHFHSRGTKFTMSVFDPTAAAPEAPFYVNEDWAEPLFERGLTVKVPAEGGIRYSCDYDVAPSDCGNPADHCCYTFGGMVEFQEHCNAFVYYYPANGTTDVNCF
jgi:hypothetical protein